MTEDIGGVEVTKKYDYKALTSYIFEYNRKIVILSW